MSRSREEAREAEAHGAGRTGSSLRRKGCSRAAGERGPPAARGQPAHLSCLVWFTMERTFSSPSIFGLPYSSSFTCWKERARRSAPAPQWGPTCPAPPQRGRVAAQGPSRCAARGRRWQNQVTRAGGCWLGCRSGRERPVGTGTGPAPAVLREQGAIDSLGHGNRPPLCGAQSRAPVRRARRPTLGSQAGENKRGLSEGGRLPVQTPSGLPGCPTGLSLPSALTQRRRALTHALHGLQRNRLSGQERKEGNVPAH